MSLFEGNKVVEEIKILAREAAAGFANIFRGPWGIPPLSLKTRTDVAKENGIEFAALGLKPPAFSDREVGKAFTDSYSATRELMKTQSLVFNLETKERVGPTGGKLRCALQGANVRWKLGAS